jgi:hypothetical protein
MRALFAELASSSKDAVHQLDDLGPMRSCTVKRAARE